MSKRKFQEFGLMSRIKDHDLSIFVAGRCDELAVAKLISDYMRYELPMHEIPDYLAEDLKKFKHRATELHRGEATSIHVIEERGKKARRSLYLWQPLSFTYTKPTKSFPIPASKRYGELYKLDKTYLWLKTKAGIKRFKRKHVSMLREGKAPYTCFSVTVRNGNVEIFAQKEPEKPSKIKNKTKSIERAVKLQPTMIAPKANLS